MEKRVINEFGWIVWIGENFKKQGVIFILNVILVNIVLGLN